MKSLVSIGVQREYITLGRPSYISSIEPALNNVYSMLQFARSQNWPIIHVQHLQDGDMFNRSSDTSDFVDGFMPERGEAIAVKNEFSSFSSKEFVDFVSEHADHEFIVVGCGTTTSCLSTIVDGYHRGYRFAMVDDACATPTVPGLSEASMHEHTKAIIKPFARLTKTAKETAI